MNGFMSPLSMQNYQGQLTALQNQISQIGQLYQQQPPQVPQQLPQPSQNVALQATRQIEYVNGMDGAKAYAIERNSSVILMDSNVNRFYAVSCDANGFKTVKSCDFTETPEEDVEGDGYATKKDFAELNKKVTELLYKIDNKGEKE